MLEKLNETPVPEAVAAAEMVTDEAPTLITVVPEGMPDPLTLIPSKSPAVSASPEIVVEPLVVFPVITSALGYVNASGMFKREGVMAVSVVDEVMADTVVPEGMPGPLTPMPTPSPTVLGRLEIAIELLAVFPVIDAVGR